MGSGTVWMVREVDRKSSKGHEVARIEGDSWGMTRLGWTDRVQHAWEGKWSGVGRCTTRSEVAR